MQIHVWAFHLTGYKLVDTLFATQDSYSLKSIGVWEEQFRPVNAID
jgi:hypothetical protein